MCRNAVLLHFSLNYKCWQRWRNVIKTVKKSPLFLIQEQLLLLCLDFLLTLKLPFNNDWFGTWLCKTNHCSNTVCVQSYNPKRNPYRNLPWFRHAKKGSYLLSKQCTLRTWFGVNRASLLSSLSYNHSKTFSKALDQQQRPVPKTPALYNNYDVLNCSVSPSQSLLTHATVQWNGIVVYFKYFFKFTKLFIIRKHFLQSIFTKTM